jgi:lysozyme
MRCNEEGLSIIKRFEGLRLEAYRCPAGVLSIGYGSTRNVTPGMKITPQEAEERLRRDVAVAEADVSRMVNVALNENQASALISFVFNLGGSQFRSSTLRALVNRGAFDPSRDPNAPDEFLKWVHSNGKVLAGLVERRKAERSLFLLPVLAKA